MLEPEVIHLWEIVGTISTAWCKCDRMPSPSYLRTAMSPVSLVLSIMLLLHVGQDEAAISNNGLSNSPFPTVVSQQSVFRASRHSRAPSSSSSPSQFNLIKEAPTGINFLKNSSYSPSSSSSSLASVGANQSLSQNPKSKTLNACEICWCSKKRDTIDCRKAIDLSAIPVMLTKADRDLVTEIQIRNQMSLQTISRSSLSLYPNLEKLIIADSGLRRFESEDVFAANRKLKEINLSNNKLKVIPWKIFDSLTILELTLNGNPLVCNCSAKWIKLQMDRDNSILGPQFDNIMCTDPFDGTQHLMNNYTMDESCNIPSVVVEPHEVYMNETDAVNLTCVAVGNPAPKVFWVTPFASNFSTETFESIVISSGHNQLEAVSSVHAPSLSTSAFQLLLNNSYSSPGQNYTIVTQNLYIHSANGSDNGFPTCVAENLVAKSAAQVMFEINGMSQGIHQVMRTWWT